MRRKYLKYYFFLLFFALISSIANSQNLATLEDTSSNLGLLNEVKDKNLYGQDKYAMDAALMSKQSIIRYSNGSECLASCPEGCCAAGESLLAEAAMYSLMGVQANLQANAHQKSAMGACQISNQLTADKTNCKAEISAMDTFVPQPSWYDADGNCKSNSPKECEFMEQFKFGDIYKAKGSAKICGANKNEPCAGMQSYLKGIQFNRDNSINLSVNGRITKLALSDFTDPKKLKSLGFSAETASDVASIYLTEVKKMESDKSPKMMYALKNTNLKPVAATGSSVQDSETNLNHQNALTNTEPNRMVSSLSAEAIYKQIGDDPIGRSDQDIFKMINNRYTNDRNFFESEK